MKIHKHCQDPNCSPACEPAKQPVRDATIRRDAIPDMPEEHERFVRAGVRLGEVGQERDKFAARNAELVAALKACVDGTPDFYGIAQGLLDDLDAEAAGKQTAPANDGRGFWSDDDVDKAEAMGKRCAFADVLRQWHGETSLRIFEAWLREKAAGR